ncbi:MAG: hypothetical protein KGK15_14210 [Burkholderiales bacterium]|nr:hypothetical protein [Burkholderiales bacterium]
MAKTLRALLFGLLALAAQGKAVYSLGHPLGGIDPLVVFFAWQALAALATALFVSAILPPHYRRARGGAFLHVFVICLFLPVGGLVLFLSLIIAALLFPAPPDDVPIEAVEAPQFATYLVSRVTHGTGARLRARLENLRAPAGDRVAALVAMQSLPSRISSGLLHDLLSDPIEEIRLLAYGIVDGTEKEIMQKIFVARAQLERATGGSERGQACSRLAELYWELIYQHLVQGEVFRYTLEQVESFAQQALAQGQEAAVMCYLLGRCALLRHTPERAEEFFRRAQALRFPADRLAPWLAEVAFLKGDYERIPPLLDTLNKATAAPFLQPIVRYWSQ